MTINQKHISTVFCLMAAAFLSAQAPDLAVFKHELNAKDHLIDLYVKTVQGGRGEPAKKQNIFIYERFEGEDSVKLFIKDIIYKDTTADAGTARQDSFTVLFLSALDTSLAAERKRLIQDFGQKTNLPASTRYFIAAYGEQFYGPEAFTMDDLEGKLSSYGTGSGYAELHKGLAESVRFLRNEPGRKVIILLSDGRDRPNRMAYDARREIPYDTSDLRYFLSTLDPNFMVFPIGIGASPDTSFLSFVANATPGDNDTYSLRGIPESLQQLLFVQRNILYNNIIRLTPNSSHLAFKGEKRQLIVIWGGHRVVYDLSDIHSTALLPDDFESPLSWAMRFLLGLVLVAGALGLMSWLVPWLQERRFRQRYVVPYKEQGGVRKRDPISGEPFQPGELVVVKCPHVTSSLGTWEYSGNHCPQYSRCLSFDPPCQGHGAPMAEDRFFSMKGIFRRLNWLWFGMAGGLVAWCLLALVNTLAYDWYYGMAQHFFEQSLNAAGRNAQELTRYVEQLTRQLMAGAAFGAGLCFGLSWVEERSQPRRFSWGRVLARTLAGTVVSLLIFLLGFYLQLNDYVENRHLAGLLTWLLFGVSVGGIMSAGSSISLSKGLLGGVLAAVPAYGVYWLFVEKLFANDYPLAILASLLVLGGILGITLVTVVAALENFELEYLSPEAFRQTNPISKWLKMSIDVFIGSEQGSYVYVKWKDDAVLPRHARLHFSKGVVFIEPFGETLLNGKILPLKKNTPLQDGDLLQLGRESVSRMRFRERRKANVPPPAPAGKGAVATTPVAPAAGGGIVIKNR